ncbi:MAG: carboxypeptidase-like regulatory domain-containing protein [Bacteroidota bacterium]
MLAPLAGAAQTTGEIVGRVTETTGGPIPGATILVTGTNYGTAAESDGTYELVIPEGRWSITVSAVGFAAVTDSVIVERRAQVRYDVALAPSDATLGEVSVVAERTNDAGVYSIDAEFLEDIPQSLADGLRAVRAPAGSLPFADVFRGWYLDGRVGPSNLPPGRQTAEMRSTVGALPAYATQF